MTAIVHFGMPKTGSTSIQNTLYRMSRKADAPFVYLSVDGHFNGNMVSKLLCRSDSRIEKLAESDPKLSPGGEGLAKRQSDVRAALTAEVEGAKSRHVIFSSEDLVFSNEEKLTEFRELFLKNGQAPRGVGYVRPPKALIESNFQQRVKNISASFSMSSFYPNYRESFEKFERVFGRENLEFWLFDSKKLLNGCVVQDFAERIGIDVSNAPIVRKNDSLSRAALSLLFALRKFSDKVDDKGNLPGRNWLIKRLKTLKGGEIRFHSSLIAPVLEANCDDIAWMEDRLGASLREDLERHDATAIRSEDDLLVLEPETLQWLSNELGDIRLAKDVLDGDPKAIAKGVEELAAAATAAGKARKAAAGTKGKKGKRRRARAKSGE